MKNWIALFIVYPTIAIHEKVAVYIRNIIADPEHPDDPEYLAIVRGFQLLER